MSTPTRTEPAAPRLVVTTHLVGESRRSLVLWSAAVAAVAAIYTASWTAVGGTKASVVDSLPSGVVDAFDLGGIATPGGYLASTVYGILGPALLLVRGISRGAGVLAGQEEAGTLELELTAPVGRRRIYLERLLAVWLETVVLVVVLTAVVLATGAAVGLGVGAGDVLAGSVGLTVLVLAVSTIAYAVGAATGRRAAGLGIAAMVAVASYAAHALGAATSASWLSGPSPWTWYLGGDPLTEGFDVLGLAELTTLLAVAAVVGLVPFERRDLGV